MTIAKRDIKNMIETYEEIIIGYKKETEKYPHMNKYNRDSILRMEGKIEVLNSLLKNFK